MNINTLQLGSGLVIGVIIGAVLFSFITTLVPQDEKSNITITKSITTTSTLISSSVITSTATITSIEIIINSQELIILSPSFEDNENIPVKFVCTNQGGQNTSPQLAWSTPPEGTESIVLIMDDPDAPGSFTHWVLFNIPADVTGLAEGLPTQNILENGGLHGRNGLGSNGYFGPCPPSGIHGYKFRIYAIDIMLTLDSRASKQDVLTAINGHILEEALLTGNFGN